eukprot:6812690-Pyramimonas_sp.AAC.1
MEKVRSALLNLFKAAMRSSRGFVTDPHVFVQSLSKAWDRPQRICSKTNAYKNGCAMGGTLPLTNCNQTHENPASMT